MKKYVTQDQFYQMSEENREKVINFLSHDAEIEESDFCDILFNVQMQSLLTVGNLIDIIESICPDREIDMSKNYYPAKDINEWWVSIDDTGDDHYKLVIKEELIDALWEIILELIYLA